MNSNKIIIGVVLATLGLLFGGIWLAQKMNKSTEIVITADAQAEVDENFYDWGTIKLKGGDVEKVFTIKNTGKQPLQLHDVQTSCMCTTAQVIINGQRSPSFGMHQKSKWVGEVPAGGMAEVKVTFAPDYHGPSGIGAITRQVKVETNDPDKPVIVFNVKAQVVN